MTRYQRGSEWRKWDMHIHVPGTKLSDGYGSPIDWTRFCRAIEESDVAAFGITDYFSFDSFLEFSRAHRTEYPNSSKVFFPNLELRLNEVVNGANQQVDIHLIFRPEVDATILRRFLAELKTQLTDVHHRNRRCSELSSTDDFNRATVARADIIAAIDETFGRGAFRSENVVLVVPSNNNGIRAASGQQRKASLADEIDKLCDAIFGNSNNSNWYLRTDRFEGSDPPLSRPKPVFAGSDSHSFEQLHDWLGQTVVDPANHKAVTWVKADPSFDGLLQTLIEPEERVRIQPTKPDQKDQYKYIKGVRFGASSDFPQEIQLNQNLVSIIGSRSSGKSALLAYIAHAIDPTYTVTQQVAASGTSRENTGPAAGKTWLDVRNVEVNIQWGDEAARSGKVIYIPQNSLYKVSERPEEITAKIKPVLWRVYPDLDGAFRRMIVDVNASNTRIEEAVLEWFRLAGSISEINDELRSIGDRKGVESVLAASKAQLDVLQSGEAVGGTNADAFGAVVDQLARAEAVAIKHVTERAQIAPYVSEDADSRERSASAAVTVNISSSPDPMHLPERIAVNVRAAINRHRTLLLSEIQSAIVSHLEVLDSETIQNDTQISELKLEHARLTELNNASAEIEEIVNKIQRQEAALELHAARTSVIEAEIFRQTEQLETIARSLAERTQSIGTFQEVFDDNERILESMQFGLEARLTEAGLADLSSGFNRQENTAYIDRSSQLLNIDQIQQDPGAFLQHLQDGTQKIKRSQEATSLACKALCLTPEVRFSATLDGDRIGGFSKSSMTPGKQALFALTLILNESSEGWPLLIDQPEDDLDSRSIYDSIVPYLQGRKRERQILMVTHNANLAIGADSEQVIVANRHGQDRRNREDATFQYLTGSLEYTSNIIESPYTLESCGVREHACQILDGGEAAFQKRRDKYKIR